MGSPSPESEAEPMSGGTPYRDFVKRLHILADYFDNNAEMASVDDSSQTYKSLQEHISTFLRKPLVGLSGRYDSGKSTLINELLGKDILPTSYQPMTSIPVVIMHSDMKPG